MSQENANSFDKEIENGQVPNSQNLENGTHGGDNQEVHIVDTVGQTIDYKQKFSESSKEALRLVEVQKEKDAEIERLRIALELKDNGGYPNGNQPAADNLYPGFEELDEDARRNLIVYTDNITKRVEDKFLRNPAIAYATKQYNEQVWDSAFSKTLQEFPELAETKDEFKAKYFNVNNVPENIDSILKDVAKIHLFDKAKSIGAKEIEEKSNRVDGERNTGGPKETTVKRSLEDWNRMAQENPAKFAQMSKEYEKDIASGNI